MKQIDIIGLRGISFLGVYIYHLNAEIMSGGYLGVDIFFFISGYYIASKFSTYNTKGYEFILDFYKNRVIRILPAELFITTFVLLIATFIFSPREYINLSKSIFTSLLFFENYYLNLQSDYFAEGLKYYPFLNLWSLSVEMQIYLIFPIIYYINEIFINKIKINNLHIILIAASLFISIYNYSINENIFFSTVCRVWEFSAGSYAYYIKNKIKTPKYCSYLGLIGIIFSFIYFDSNSNPFLSRILIIIYTYLIFKENNNIFLRNRFVIAVGEKSYSSYLVHYPVIVFVNMYIFYENKSYIYYIFATIITILLTNFSFHYFEKINIKN